MAENYKHLYEQTKKMLVMYQDELIPGFRKQLDEIKEKAKDIEERHTKLNKLFDEAVSQIPRWIPVTERLPEEDGKYLVFEQSSGRTNTSILRFAKDARKVDRYDFKGRWKNAWYEYDSEWGHYTVNSVTHWMPLPEPPKGE